MKSMLYGRAIVLVAGSATAQTFDEEDAATSASASAQYSVDEDRDGRTDSELILEQSDSLA